MNFYQITHQLFTGLPETGSTCDLLKSHLGNTWQATAWKAAEEGSLRNTRRRSGNLKNENQIIGSAPLFPFNTANSAGRLVTQAAPKSSCVISSYNLPTLSFPRGPSALIRQTVSSLICLYDILWRHRNLKLCDSVGFFQLQAEAS